MWEGEGGPATVAPLFLLYDYTFGRNIAPTKEEALARAYDSGVVCSDEFLLHADPYPSREAWCHARVGETERRLTACDRDIPTVLINHFPLINELTRVLWYPEFAQWCGTTHTADWHRRFQATRSGLWAVSALPPYQLARWSGIRGGLAGLPARVEWSRILSACAAPDIASGGGVT